MAAGIGNGQLNLSNFAPALKQYYTDDRVRDMVYKKNPLLALVEKFEDFEGTSLPIPVIIGNPQGRSATFATAKNNKGNSTVKSFVLTRVADYSLYDLDNQTIQATMSNKGAFLRAVTTEINGAMNALVRSCAVKMYRNGTGSIGQVSANATVNDGVNIGVVPLSYPDDVTNIEVGMSLVFSATDGGALRNAGAQAWVVGVNRSTGTFTVSATQGGAPAVFNTIVAAVAPSDYIYVEGDAQAGATTALCLAGLKAWLPFGGPTSTLFFGLDRTVDATRLGGVYFDGRSKPMEEVCIKLLNTVAREGGSPDYIFMNYNAFNSLVIDLGAKVTYVDVEVGDKPGVGFQGVKIIGPNGPAIVIPDMNCPADAIFALQMDTWCLYSLKKVPQVIDFDGLTSLRDPNSDSFEGRLCYFAQVGCQAPGWNGVAQITPVTQ